MTAGENGGGTSGHHGNGSAGRSLLGSNYDTDEALQLGRELHDLTRFADHEHKRNFVEWDSLTPDERGWWCYFAHELRKVKLLFDKNLVDGAAKGAARLLLSALTGIAASGRSRSTPAIARPPRRQARYCDQRAKHYPQATCNNRRPCPDHDTTEKP